MMQLMSDLRKTSTGTMEGRQPDQSKRPWEPVRLRYVGHISDIIKTGGGKLTVTGGDPGEGKKPSGGG